MTHHEYLCSTHQKQVNGFMRNAGQEIPDVPTQPSQETRLLRAKLILEEAIETINALGVRVYMLEGGEIAVDSVRFKSNAKFDMVKAVDGCLDLRVVTTGTLSALGVPDVEGQRIVDDANLRKFTPPNCPKCGFEMISDEQGFKCDADDCHGMRLPKEAGPHRNQFGKWVKPPNFVPPDHELLNLLIALGWKA